MRRNLPSKTSYIGRRFDRFPEHTIEAHVGSGANGRLFHAFNKATDSHLAFKIVPAANLPKGGRDRDAYLLEAKTANQLEHASVIRCHDVFPDTDPDGAGQNVVFVFDYVNGMDLSKHIKEKPENIDVPFVETFLRTMLEVLYELQQRKSRHGDLHAGNVLVAKSEYDVYGRTTFRVTDFGVRQVSERTQGTSDYLGAAEMLRQLLECIEYRDCEGRDRFIYDMLRTDFLQRHLIETDVSADPLACQPKSMLTKLDSLDDRYREESKKNSTESKLVTPFDYPNCEQMGNSHLLLKSLYSDRLLGLTDIHARFNIVLTGPRGCGKTTVFRALSLDYLTFVEDDDPSNMKHVGIYYRCDDLYFNFPRYETPERPEALDVPMHFLIATLLTAALEQLEQWAKRHFLAEFKKKEKELVSELWQLLGLPQPDGSDVDRLATLVGRLRNKERKRAARKQRFVRVAEAIENYCGPEAMIEACRVIRECYSFLKDRPFYFFIDDYSDPKITNSLQANLNRLLMFRSPDVFFKLSTESPESFAREDVDGKKFVESREYSLVNLGLLYITADESNQRLQFLKDLFNRRFHEVQEYPVRNLEDLLGSTPRNENAVARAIQTREPRQGMESRNYSGCETVAALCSGDIYYMIRLVSKMVEDHGGKDALADSNTSPRISPSSQNRSVRAAAGEFMQSIRTLPGRGPHLAAVVSAFGNVARSYLLYETSNNGPGRPPHQASRIEPYEALRLSDDAMAILRDLLRYSIFIEDPRGKSRRGQTVPRFYLRRYLIPHFGLTFSRRDSLQLENDDLDCFLCDPRRFEDKMRLKSREDAQHRREQRKNRASNGDQADLF